MAKKTKSKLKKSAAKHEISPVGMYMASQCYEDKGFTNKCDWLQDDIDKAVEFGVYFDDDAPKDKVVKVAILQVVKYVEVTRSSKFSINDVVDI